MASIEIGRVADRGSAGGAPAPKSPSDARAQAVFERELVTRARAAGVSAIGPAHGGGTKTVAATATRLSGGQAAASLATAWNNVFHEPPSPETLRVLVAQWSHETGGGRAMMNNNFGGIKGAGPSGLSAAYLTTEGQKGSQVKLVDRFRAYGSTLEGATDYVRFLSTRFSGAMAQARQGDAEGFVRALKQGGYFTGSEEDYVRSVTSLTERARVSGFDAVGHGGPPAPPAAPAGYPGQMEGAHSIAAQTIAAGAGSSDAAAQAQSFYAADALAMADELCRAALRIATTDEERRRG